MHLLFLTQVLPYPLDAGPKIRAYYVLRYLAQADHEITLLSFVRDSDRPEAIEHLRGYCQDVITVPMRRSRARDVWHGLRSLANGTPFLIARDRAPEMITAVKSAVRDAQFEIIHADQLWMAPYALLARNPQSAIRNPTLVLDQHNAVFQIPQRLARWETNPLKRILLALEARKLAHYEAHLCRQFDRIVWVTEEDRAAVGRQPSAIGDPPSAVSHTQYAARDTVIPICVDPQAKPVLRRHPNPHRVTFLGGMHWPPNAEGVLWFAREVWPRVQAAAPDARLTIIGKRPPRLPAAVGGRRSAVEITGYVSDPTPYLQETAVFIVPLQAGGGMRVKILEAWCWGLPVVTTTIGGEGIRVRHGENALVADTAEAFAEAVARILLNPELGTRLAAGGRRAVEAHYDWRKIYQAWDMVYTNEPPMSSQLPPCVDSQGLLAGQRGTVGWRP